MYEKKHIIKYVKNIVVWHNFSILPPACLMSGQYPVSKTNKTFQTFHLIWSGRTAWWHCLLEESLAGPCLHCLCECWPGPSQWLRRQPWEYLFCVLYSQRSARHQVTRVTQQSQSTHYVTDDVRLDNAVAGDDCIYLEGDWTECDNKARVRFTFLPWYGLQITSWMLSVPEQRRLASSLPY